MPGSRNEAKWESEPFDDEFAVGPDEGNRAFFGRDVLRGLIDGIDDYVEERQPRWKQFRSLGPVLLGCAPWVTDDAFIDRLATLAGACVVVIKRGEEPRDHRDLEQLRRLNERTHGLPLEAFATLSGLAPKGRLIGPYDRIGEESVPTFRTIGFRKQNRTVMHAKLALLGHLWWHDEGPLGHVEDVIGFKAKRLWISSANFTRMSRLSLEFGYWTEEPALVQGAERFLLRLMRSSEALDPASDAFEPDLAPVEFDEEAMGDAMRDHMDWMREEAEMNELDDEPF
jgi:hypothetical protein